MRRCWWSLLSTVTALGCGGGTVDRGFYGDAPVEDAAPAPSPSAAPSGSAPAAPTSASFERARVVVIRASWCPACIKTERALIPALGAREEDIDLLVLDVSDDEAIRSSREIAARAGLSTYFETHRGVTPSIALVSKSGRLRPYEGNPYRRESWDRVLGELVAASTSEP